MFRTIRFRFPDLFSSSLLAVIVCCLLLGGCSKEKMDELVQSTKDKIDDTTKSASEKINEVTASGKAAVGLSGSMTLAIEPAVTTEACYASFVEPAGRPNVLQLQSYINEGTESFPSALIHANVGDLTQSQLSGKTIQAQVFVQNDPSGPVWHTNSGESIEIKIDSLADNKISAKIVSGKIYNSQTGTAVDLGGQLEGIFH